MRRPLLPPAKGGAEPSSPRASHGASARLFVLALSAAAASLLAEAPAIAGSSVDAEVKSALSRFGDERPPSERPAPLFLLPSVQVFMPEDGGPPQIFPGYSYHFDGIDPLGVASWRLRAPFVRAAAEVATVISLNMAIYWLSPGFNSPDWELSWDAKSWREKAVTFKGVLFDTNNFTTNTVSHPIAGALYYTAARSNNMTVWQSYAMSFGSSAFWEYISEYKERVSLNDLITTPAAGAAIGESFQQMSLFLGRGSHGFLNELFGLVFSPFARLNQQIEPRLAPRASPVNGLGLPSDTYHRFDVSFGAGVTAMDDGTRRGEGEIEVETELINLPEYDRREDAARAVSDGSFSRLHGRFSFASGRLYEGTALAKAALVGYFMQDSGRGAGGLGATKSVFVGASTAFDFSLHELSSTYKDQVAIANLPGPTIDASFRKGALRLRASLDVGGDFGSVSSPALSQYAAERGVEGIKTVLAAKKYYFATGVTIRPRMSVEYGKIELVSDTSIDYFYSIQGYDRFQPKVTRDFALSDRRLLNSVSLRYRQPYPWGGAVRTPDFGAAPWIRVEHASRYGQIGTTERTMTEDRYQVGVTLIF